MARGNARNRRSRGAGNANVKKPLVVKSKDVGWKGGGNTGKGKGGKGKWDSWLRPAWAMAGGAAADGRSISQMHHMWQMQQMHQMWQMQPMQQKSSHTKVVKNGFAARAFKSKKGNVSPSLRKNGRLRQDDGKRQGTKLWEKLKGMDRGLKVKVENLAAETTGKQIKNHFKEFGIECQIVELMLAEKGAACVGFESSEQAESAITMMGGSELGGQSLDVTPWTRPQSNRDRQKVKKETSGNRIGKIVASKAKANESKKATPIVVKEAKKSWSKSHKGPVVVKNAVTRVASKDWEKLKVMDRGLKVKVENMAMETTVKQLKDHFKEVGVECQFVEFMLTQKGAACVGFESAEQAESAIIIVGGSELGGQNLDVIPWTRPESSTDRKVKKANA